MARGGAATPCTVDARSSMVRAPPIVFPAGGSHSAKRDMREPTTPSADRALAEEAGDTVTWSWNVATGDVTWSKGIEQALFGLPSGAFAGTFEAYLALVHPDDRAYFHAVIARTLAGEDEYVMSHRVIWPDGSIHWIDGRGLLTRDPEGRPLILSGVAWTATARRLAEARLTHLRRVQAVAGAVSKELLRVQRDEQAFEHACRIAVEHGHFRFAWIGLVARGEVRVRPMARAGFEDGYLDEIQVTVDRSLHGAGPGGRCVREGSVIIVNDTATEETFEPWRERALRRGYLACGAFPLRRGGDVVGVFLIYAAEKNRFDDDQIELLRGLADDMGFKLDAIDAIDADERRRSAEQAMRRSEERHRALVEQAADAIFLADADTTLLEVNPATCDMTGYPREELVGRKLDLLFDPSERGEPSLLIGHRPGSRIAGERRLRRKDGTLIVTEVTATVLADGRIQGYSRDVTQRNADQQKLILADRLTSLGRLAAGVAHEINNPLAYLLLNLERIERAADTDAPAMAEIRAATADALDGAERVRAVVRSLGAFSRQDEGAVGAVDLPRVLDGAVRLAENSVRHRGRIVKDYAATRGARGNELRLGQVFVNLLVNASDALRDGAAETNEIRVRTFDEGDRVVVEVTDNGVGIPPAIIGRIFDPFFTTKAVGDGTGLGLSISHGIVSAFGGQIGVESRNGEGTTFRVALLAEDAPAPMPRASVVREAGPSLRILLVDDEENLARGLAALLDQHVVTITTSGREALALARSHPYDAIVCDLMMPGVSGIDVHTELVHEGRGQDRRMIFMTGGAFTPRAREFVARLSNVVLEKPFTASRVEAAIATVLAREGPNR